jgi:hypothetical protein
MSQQLWASTLGPGELDRLSFAGWPVAPWAASAGGDAGSVLVPGAVASDEALGVSSDSGSAVGSTGVVTSVDDGSPAGSDGCGEEMTQGWRKSFRTSSPSPV